MKAKYEDVKKFQEKLMKLTGGTTEKLKEREALFSKPRISIVTRLDEPSVSNTKDTNKKVIINIQVTDMLKQRFIKALEFATNLHSKQTRKGSDIPFISHLLSVYALILEDGGSEDEDHN